METTSPRLTAMRLTLAQRAGFATVEAHTAHKRAEYAAMCARIDDPATLSFARRSIGLGKVAMAARFGLPVEAFMDIENNRENTARVSYVYLLRGWLKKSDRCTFAVRRLG